MPPESLQLFQRIGHLPRALYGRLLEMVDVVEEMDDVSLCPRVPGWSGGHQRCF